MRSRRNFIMVMLAAAAAGATGFITTWLGSARRDEAGNARPEPTTAATLVPQLRLVTRSEWGALEPAVYEDGSGENGPFNALTNPSGWLVYDQPLEELLNLVIIHHSALPLSDGPREIQKLHMEEKGFADVGYHFLIDQMGELFEGRALNVRGAHTFGSNYASVGICLIGNFEEITPPEDQLGTLQALLTQLTGQFPKITSLAGHRDLNTGTLCPGANLYPLLPDLANQHKLEYL